MKVGRNRLTLFNAGSRKFYLETTGTSADPVTLRVKIGPTIDEEYEFSAEEIEGIQSALLNFLNTGYFDVEA